MHLTESDQKTRVLSRTVCSFALQASRVLLKQFTTTTIREVGEEFFGGPVIILW